MLFKATENSQIRLNCLPAAPFFYTNVHMRSLAGLIYILRVSRFFFICNLRLLANKPSACVDSFVCFFSFSSQVRHLTRSDILKLESVEQYLLGGVSTKAETN